MERRTARSLAPTLFVGALVSVSLLLPLLSPAAEAQAPTRYSLSGKDVAIYNLIGEARVVAGSGPDTEVEVTLGGPDAGDLEIETGTLDGRQALRVIYPGTKLVYAKMGAGSSTTLPVKDNGTFGGTGFEGRKVRIAGKGPGMEAWADLTIRVPPGKTVRVFQAVGEGSARDVEADLLFDTANAPISAESIRGSLKVDVGSGSVQALRIEGDLHVDTGSGDVHLQEVRGSRVHVDTGSGQVTGDGIAAPNLSVDTGSGEIALTGVESDEVALDTGSGAVSIQLVGDLQSMAIDTGSGSVRVGVPSTLGAEVRLDTGSGDVEVDVPHEAQDSRRPTRHFRLGDGRGEIEIETGSGDVLIAGESQE